MECLNNRVLASCDHSGFLERTEQSYRLLAVLRQVGLLTSYIFNDWVRKGFWNLLFDPSDGHYHSSLSGKNVKKKQLISRLIWLFGNLSAVSSFFSSSSSLLFNRVNCLPKCKPDFFWGKPRRWGKPGVNHEGGATRSKQKEKRMWIRNFGHHDSKRRQNWRRLRRLTWQIKSFVINYLLQISQAATPSPNIFLLLSLVDLQCNIKLIAA